MQLRNRLSVFVAIAAWVAVSGNVQAEPAPSKSGRYYIEACHGFVSLRPDPTGILQHKCVEIVQSSSDYEQALRRECLPENATTRQLIAVVVDYLDNHPDLLDQDLAVLASSALRAKYPCSKGI